MVKVGTIYTECLNMTNNIGTNERFYEHYKIIGTEY